MVMYVDACVASMRPSWQLDKEQWSTHMSRDPRMVMPSPSEWVMNTSWDGETLTMPLADGLQSCMWMPCMMILDVRCMMIHPPPVTWTLAPRPSIVLYEFMTNCSFRVMTMSCLKMIHKGSCWITA
uniref:Uncharacterized protein n=1 Tax=Opuntia streptacantha TaxID=393608 RepID=A0A7C8ZFU7_OPUST